jgi:cyanophycin synthetase
MTKKHCEHCWPTRRKGHFLLHFGYYCERFFSAITRPFGFLKRKKSLNFQDYLWGLFLEFFALFGIVKFLDNPDESKIYNRSLIFFNEAKSRGLDIKSIMVLGKQMSEFRLCYEKKRYYFEGIPLTIIGKDRLEMDDKDYCKKILEKNDLPIAKGDCFTSKSKALDFGSELGFPLVVKPFDGSLSHHVTCPINSVEQLEKAIDVAKIYTPAFIVEKYIEGKLFRASVIGRKHLFVCQKDIANVVGDGQATIQALINQKNADVKRGDTGQCDFTLHKIPVNDVLLKNLENQGLELGLMPQLNQKIYLQNKFVLSHGCDIIDHSEATHIKNNELFLKVAKIFKSDLVGIDFICSDISQSHEEQSCAILETNSLPYIDMHQVPSHGEAQPVARVAWDVVLGRLREVNRSKSG